MLPCYVVLDLETTGGSPQRDRITEIAAVRIEGGQEAARWSTLVNPGTPIPFFIQNLTGISNQMVRDASTFAKAAPRLLELLDGAVLVAHNAPFDHGFLRGEFARLQTDLRVKTLCTVRLSRSLYPQHLSHSLDAIMQRHGLSSSSRHRAMGDVDVVLAWLNVAALEHGVEQVRRHAGRLVKGTPLQLEAPLELHGLMPDHRPVDGRE
jgi:DNA polymerase-3 subunit epsilon